MVPNLDMPRRLPSEVDVTLLWSGLALLLLGMVMVYSSSIAIAEASRAAANNPAHYLLRHAVFLAVGLVAAGVAFQIPLATWQQLAPWLFVAGCAMLMLVLVPGIGREVNGARRWFSLSSSTLSPCRSKRA